MKIITNNQYRPILCGYDLPANKRGEFDYLSDDDFNSNSFFKYKSEFYDLGEFVRCDIAGWQGCKNDSYFSGMFIKISDCGDAVIVATYYS